MAANINLLPNELRVSAKTGGVLSIFRMLGVISLAVFLIFGVGLGAFFIISNLELNNLKTSNDDLKNQLSALSATESQFFILKDRLNKIKTAKDTPVATRNLTDFEQYISPFQVSSLQELNVSSKKISATINFTSNTEMKVFIDTISGSEIYDNIKVDSFGYNPASGYQISLIATPK